MYIINIVLTVPCPIINHISDRKINFNSIIEIAVNQRNTPFIDIHQ